jgi:hypothetical protein
MSAASMLPQGIMLLRPLLSIPKVRPRGPTGLVCADGIALLQVRLVATNADLGLQWVQDPSNENMLYDRARIRKVVSASIDGCFCVRTC